MEKPTLVIDTREKLPWDFEGDDDFEDVIYEKLDAGDYAIKGIEKLCVIERKATADELLNNFFSKAQRTRIYAEIDRLQEYKYKFIVIEEDLLDLMHPDSYYYNKSGKNKGSNKIPIAVVISNLTDIMLQHGVHVIFAGARGQAFSKGILLRVHELYRKGKL